MTTWRGKRKKSNATKSGRLGSRSIAY
jgi:hypothetical protein